MSPATDKLLEEAPAAPETTVETIGRVHPAADIFPMMSIDEYKKLYLSIKTHGLLEPITLYEGNMLDGRHRAMACVELGIELRTESYEGSDPLGFVMAKNLDRRHLTTSQRSAIAAKLADMRQGERTDLDPSAKLQKVSQAQAAKMFNVSPRSVADATYVLDHGSPDLVAAVERGDMKVSAAKVIADLPPEEQQHIAQEKNPGTRRAAIKAAKKSTKQKTTKAAIEPPEVLPATESPATDTTQRPSMAVEARVAALERAAEEVRSSRNELTAAQRVRVSRVWKRLESIGSAAAAVTAKAVS